MNGLAKAREGQEVEEALSKTRHLIVVAQEDDGLVIGERYKMLNERRWTEDRLFIKLAELRKLSAQHPDALAAARAEIVDAALAWYDEEIEWSKFPREVNSQCANLRDKVAAYRKLEGKDGQR